MATPRARDRRFTRRRTRRLTSASAAAALAWVTGAASGATLYWDTNGAVPGASAGITAPGSWTAANWSEDPAGAALTQTFASGDHAVFSAGANATGAFAITSNATASSVLIQEGSVTFNGNITVGTGIVTVEAGALLSTNSASRIAIDTGGGFILNGATLQSTSGAASGFFVDPQATITLNGGGTLDYTVASTLNILQPDSVILGTGPLNKTGVGVVAIASAAAYSGATIISGGELRIRAAPDRLPVATDVTVSSPGILNLNSVSQRIASLSGNGLVGLGSATLIIDGAASTTFGGIIRDTANAGASGTTETGGNLSKNGGGTLTLTGVNNHTGATTITAGGIVVSAGAALSNHAANLTLTGGTLTLNNAAQTIKNLSGIGGTIQLGGAHVLTIDPAAATSYAGTISGTGGLTKANVLRVSHQTTTLSGANTYSGPTLITQGALVAASSSALGSAASGTTVNSGATLGFRGGINYAAAEAVSIAGGGFGSAGAISNVADHNLFAGPVTMTADASIGAAAAGSLTLWGDLSGAFALTKVGAGTVLLVNPSGNSYSGPTSITAGTLIARADGALGAVSSGTVVSSGGTLGFAGGIDYASAESVSIAGVGVDGVGAISNVSGDNTFAGAVSMTSDARIGAAEGSLTIANAVSGTSALTIGGSGTIRLGAGAALPSAGNLVIDGGNLDLNTTAQTVASGAGKQVILQNNGTIQGGTLINASSSGVSSYIVQSGSVGAVLAGAGAGLTKNTSGAVTLTAANTYGGNTVVAGGTLLINNAGGSGTGSGNVTVSATLGGTGSISGNITINAGGRIAAGAGNANDDLDVQNITLNTGSIMRATLGAPGAPLGSSDILDVNAVNGLNLAGTSAVEIATSNGFASGTYRVIKYNTSYAGSFANLSPSAQLGFDSVTLIDNVAQKAIDVAVVVTERSWIADADGDWSTGSNWGAAATQPLGPGAIANLIATSPNNPPRTVTLDDGDKTIGVLNFNNAGKYTVAGTNALIIDTWGADGVINIASGSHEIAAPLTLLKRTNVSVSNAGNTLTISGTISGSGGLINTGAGALAVSGDIDVASGMTLANTGAGTMTITGSISGAGTLTKASAGAVNAKHVRTAGLVVSGGVLNITPNGTSTGTSVLATVDTTGGRLNLNDNKLIVTTAGSTGSWNGVAYDGITAQIAAGYADGAWNGNGIVTTMSAAAAPNFVTSLGVATAGSVGKTSFGGQSVAASDTLVMYTWNGDANLSGKVDADDYWAIDSNYNKTASNAAISWRTGDFNYDGAINGDDYTLIDIGFTGQSGILSSGAIVASAAGAGGAGGVTAVPEPAALILLPAIAAAVLAPRRRRS